MTYGQLLGQGSKQEGIEIGLIKGLTKCMEKGMQAEKLQIAKNMLREGLALQTINKITGLTLNEIGSLK
jgi:predicted transposase/invertase (TIGR01784 family)